MRLYRKTLWKAAVITILLVTASMAIPSLSPILQPLLQQLDTEQLHTQQPSTQQHSTDLTSASQPPSQPSTILNVKDYGAKGNGIHDDTLPIQRVLDMATRLDDLLVVYFPAGIYKVNPQDTLTVHSNTKVFGDGKLSIIQANADQFGWELFSIAGEDVVVENLLLDGNQAVNRVVVVRSNSAAIQMESITVMNASQSKDVNSGYYDQVVSGIIIYGNTHDITINNSEISHLTAPHHGWITRGIYITTMWDSNEKVPTSITISNNDIHHVGSADDGDCIYYEDTSKETTTGLTTHSLITNNHLEACAKRAIKLYANGIIVDGNHIVNSYLHNNLYFAPAKKRTVAPDMYAGISVYGDDITVSNNTLDGTGSYYAAIEIGATATVNNINITSNTIKMGTKSKISGSTAIRVGNIMDFFIRDNHIENGQRAVWLWQSAAQGFIQNNFFYMPKLSGVDVTKQQQHTHNQIKISDNDFRYLKK